MSKKYVKAEVDGKELLLAVELPSNKVRQDGDVVASSVLAKAIQQGALIRQEINNEMKRRNLWNDEKEQQEKDIRKALRDGEIALARGKIRLSEAKKIAIQMRRDRFKLQDLLAERNSLDLHTAESQAENARFNYFVAACTVYADTGKPYFKNVDEYMEKQDSDAAMKAAREMGNLMYNLEDDFEKKLPENKFLLKYKFCNEDLRLIDRDGNLVDSEGNRIDEKGRRVNEKGEIVDIYGQPITEEGEYKVEFEEFEDDLSAEGASSAEEKTEE